MSGFEGKFLIGEEAAGAPESALNFIGDSGRPWLGGKRASAIQKYFADGIDSSFALDCFKKDGADSVVEFRLESATSLKRTNSAREQGAQKGRRYFSVR